MKRSSKNRVRVWRIDKFDKHIVLATMMKTLEYIIASERKIANKNVKLFAKWELDILRRRFKRIK